MRRAQRLWVGLAWIGASLATAPVLAQESTAAATASAPAAAVSGVPSSGALEQRGPSSGALEQRAALTQYFEAFEKKHLVSGQAAPVGELRALLRKAEDLEQDGQDEEAALLLLELTLHPRFADYSDLEEMDAAHYALGSTLHALGAEQSARAALRKVLEKGPDNPYFAPAFRRFVDVSLAGEPMPPAIAELSAYEPKLGEDAQNELGYLRARERYDAGDREAAKVKLALITKHSRFYANAQYLLGAIAADEKRWNDAEGHLCKIATGGDNGRFSFYVDGRYFRIKDLARLGLGRVAHEQRRGDDAFYYYFQVPNDSPRLPESMFEAAYSRYESGDYESAIDLLDQLEARFPHSASADEAALLRGYVALSHCDFDKAHKHFEQFIQRFEPVHQEIGRILNNPARREALYEELSQPEDRKGGSAVHSTLLALLRVDPLFNDLHDRLRKLDREAARAGHLREAFELIEARYQGSDRPRPVEHSTSSEQADVAALQTELSDARQALRALNEQLDAMRALGAKSSALAPYEKAQAELAVRLRKAESGLDDVRLALLPEAADLAEAKDDKDVAQLLANDAKAAGRFERRVISLRPKLVSSANDRAYAELTALNDRLSGFLRRARIGRIDAVMGSKRRVEVQIESLAAGRFPAELRDPLLVQGFLADDEEYWPFEGEDWPDEYLERYGDDTQKGAP
jgi:TolA-binding protein